MAHLILFAAFPVLGFAVLLTAVLRPRARAVLFSSWFILAWANVVFSAQVVSLLDALSPLGMIVAHTFLAAGAAALWLRAGRPDPFAPLRRPLLLPPLRSHPWLYLLAAGVGLSAMIGLALVILVPPNTVDSMTYHLARIGYWFQQGSFDPWPTQNPRQTTFPINAEIGLLWLQMFVRGDRLAGLVQWTAWLAAGCAIYAVAQALGAGRPAAFFAALAWAAFPEIFFQSTSTQNDLVTAAFFMISLQFMLYGLGKEQRRFLLLSGMALGLALGAKSTMVFLLPALALCALILFFSRPRLYFPLLWRWALACLLGFSLLGSYIYIQNWIAYGNPVAVADWTPSLGVSSSKLAQFGATSFLHAYQSFDFSGLPGATAQALQNLKARAANRALAWLSLPDSQRSSLFPGSLINQPVMLHEDTSWFGPLGWIAGTAALWIAAILAVRRRDVRLLFPLLLAAGFYLTLSYLLPTTLYRGRYFVLAVTAAAPALAFIYRSSRRGEWVAALMALFSLVILFRCTLENPSKPILSAAPFWTRDRVALQTVNRAEMDPVIRMVQNLPPASTLALKTGLEGWDYPFFGPDLSRRIVQLNPAGPALDGSLLDRLDAGFVLVEPGQRDFLTLPDGLAWEGSASGWTLYRRSDTPAALLPEVQALLSGLSDASGLVQLDSSLLNRVGISQAGSQHWGIEADQGRPLLWIGEGREQGLQFSLVAVGETRVRLAFSLQPGPGLPSTARRFALLQTYSTQTLSTELREADLPGELVFTVALRPGVNQFVFLCQDAAILRRQANGDMRPLLARLNQLLITPLP